MGTSSYMGTKVKQNLDKSCSMKFELSCFMVYNNKVLLFENFYIEHKFKAISKFSYVTYFFLLVKLTRFFFFYKIIQIEFLLGIELITSHKLQSKQIQYLFSFQFQIEFKFYNRCYTFCVIFEFRCMYGTQPIVIGLLLELSVIFMRKKYGKRNVEDTLLK